MIIGHSSFVRPVPETLGLLSQEALEKITICLAALIKGNTGLFKAPPPLQISLLSPSTVVPNSFLFHCEI